MRFDFENAQSWDVSTDTLLPVGNHVCTIESAESGDSKGGYPQIELEVSGEKGTRKDWLVYKEENGVRKVATLFRAAQVAISNDDQDESTGKLKDEAVARLVGKKVGVIVREEESYKEPGKMVPRIKGYVDPAVIAATPEPAGVTAGTVRDEDIPF